MPLVLADRVVEQTTTQGTNNFELIGTSAGYQAFSVVGNGSTVYYTAEGVNDDGTLTGQWEVGQGVYNAGVLSRDTILSSSTGSKVSFSAGQKNVFIDLPSEKAVVLDDTDKVSGYNISGGTINGTSIGATTPSTGAFTTLSSTDQANIGGIVGNENVVIPTGVNSGVSALYLWGGAATGTAGGRVYSGGSGASSNLNFGAKSTGQIRFYTNQSAYDQNWSNLQFSVTNTSSAVNYVQVTGAATTGAPVISAQGSDTNIGMNLNTKGAGVLSLQVGGTTRFSVDNTSNTKLGIAANSNPAVQITATGSQVNYLNMVGSVANQEPLLSAQGSDTNISLALQSKGTGSIDLASGSTGVNVSNGTTVTAITRTAGGNSYTTALTASISAPNIAGGVQATMSVGVGAITQAISSGGTGYTVGDILTVSGGTFINSAPQAIRVDAVSGGVITGISISVFGQYTVLPTNPVSVTGGTGTGATFNLSNWSYTGHTITNAGSGYTSQPTVTFSGGGGSGASAYATVGSNTVFRTLGAYIDLYTDNNAVVTLRSKNTSGGSPTNGTTPAFGFIPPQSNFGAPMLGFSSSPYFTWGGTGNAVFQSNATNPQTSGNSGVTQFIVAHTASAVNYVQVTGASTGNRVALTAQGSDTNVGINILTKGSGEIIIGGNSGREALVVTPSTSAATNFLQIVNGATGVAPIIRPSAFSVDTNVDLSLTTKGTGAVNLNTGNGTAFRASQAFLTGTAVNYIDASGRQTGLGAILSVNGSDTNVRFNITSKGNEAVGLYTNLANQLQFNVTHTASAVNYVQVTGSATGNNPIISTQGSDANRGMDITTKGTGNLRILSANSTNVQLVVLGSVASVNNLTITGSVAGQAPTVGVSGTDTNINLALTPKGTGRVQFGTHTATADTAISGYIEILDAGGTVRRLAVIS